MSAVAFGAMTKQQDYNKLNSLRTIINTRRTRITKSRHGKQTGGVMLNAETIKPYVEELKALGAKLAKDKK